MKGVVALAVSLLAAAVHAQSAPAGEPQTWRVLSVGGEPMPGVTVVSEPFAWRPPARPFLSSLAPFERWRVD
ncbi:MAG: hypothetical protein KAI24_19445, partial [Planctomycetes bacterium]|nr:hypothetical protein [Planctomycetota bacterium]